MLGALPTPHLPIPVARITGDTVVQAPVGQRLLFIEDKLLQLHLHFCAGHSTWRGRKHKAVTGGSALKWYKGAGDIEIVIQETADTMEASRRKEKAEEALIRGPLPTKDFYIIAFYQKCRSNQYGHRLSPHTNPHLKEALISLSI